MIHVYAHEPVNAAPDSGVEHILQLHSVYIGDLGVRALHVINGSRLSHLVIG